MQRANDASARSRVQELLAKTSLEKKRLIASLRSELAAAKAEALGYYRRLYERDQMNPVVREKHRGRRAVDR